MGPTGYPFHFLCLLSETCPLFVMLRSKASIFFEYFLFVPCNSASQKLTQEMSRNMYHTTASQTKRIVQPDDRTPAGTSS